VSRIVGAFVNPVVSSVDVDAVLQQVDVDDIVERVDIANVIDRIDVNAVMDRVDLDRLMARVDVNQLLSRIDLDRLLQRLDVESVVERIDVDGVLDKVDLPRVIERVQVSRMVASTAGEMALSALDLVRRHLTGADWLVCYGGLRVFRRRRVRWAHPRPDVSGAPAGAITRLVAYIVDTATIIGVLSLGVLLVSYLAGLFVGHTVDPRRAGGPWWIGVTAAAVIFYFWAGWTMTGRTVGMALMGLRVVRSDGGEVRGRSAFLRALVFPFSLILAVGVIPIVLQRDRRAWHDFAANTMVIYDWGDRPAQMSAAVDKWLAPRTAADRGHPDQVTIVVEVEADSGQPKEEPDG
jgi:uncharacterized RDD family membrane protein YckC